MFECLSWRSAGLLGGCISRRFSQMDRRFRRVVRLNFSSDITAAVSMKNPRHLRHPRSNSNLRSDSNPRSPRSTTWNGTNTSRKPDQPWNEPLGFHRRFAAHFGVQTAIAIRTWVGWHPNRWGYSGFQPVCGLPAPARAGNFIRKAIEKGKTEPWLCVLLRKPR